MDDILEFFGLNQTKKSGDYVCSNRETFEQTIAQLLNESEKIRKTDPDAYKKMMFDLKSLTESYYEYEKARAAKVTAEAEAAANIQRERLKKLDTIVRITGISFAGLMTIFWFMVEQERPVAIRLSRAIHDFLTLRV